MNKSLKRLLLAALDEDIGQEDITTNRTVPADLRCRTRLLAKQDGVLSGIEVFRMTFDCLKAGITEWDSLSDGDRFSDGDDIATFQGNARAVLTAERTAINFVRHLCGVATLTAKYVAAVADLGGEDLRHPEDHAVAAPPREGSRRTRGRRQPPAYTVQRGGH